ncbi:MAG: CPBP family intramembrane metalloprotease [Oscillospiraceae bacterium]|nr:CPBP family intramembrane metalloprotease [Oscillospiraceae bacterium]
MEYFNKNIKNYKIIYILLFYLVWTICQLVIRPALYQITPDGSILFQILFDGVLKNLLWTVPALFLIRKFNQKLWIKSGELFQNPLKLETDQKKEILWIILLEIIFCVLNSVVSHKGLYFRTDGLPECVSFLFVGITEEFVFRAWLLNSGIKDNNQKNQYFAIAVNAILFLCIHFPIWILQGNFITNFTSLGFVMILALSVFFSWTMLRFRNIWIPVGVHMLWDILVTILN